MSAMSLVVEQVALIPVRLLFFLTALSWEVLTFITGAEEPLYRQGENGIPESAWRLWSFLPVLGLILFFAHSWVTNRKHILVHAVIFVTGLFSVLMIGRINFPFKN
jgi:hypothetical protein